MKRIAVFTSGGDAPGMNACVRAVVRAGLYHGLDVYGIRYGYNGMVEGDIFPMTSYSVSNTLQRGGTFLKSARSEEFRTKEGRKRAFDNLAQKKIEGVEQAIAAFQSIKWPASSVENSVNCITKDLSDAWAAVAATYCCCACSI